MEDTTSSRLNDQLRVHIQDLKRELEEERNKVKNVKHEKIREIKAAREEEQRKAMADKEELKKQMHRQMQTELMNKLEGVRKNFDAQLADLKKAHSGDLETERKKFEKEKRDLEEKIRTDVRQKLKAEMESIQKAETKKLIQELFVAEKRVTESEGKVKDLQTENRILKESLQEQDRDHEKELGVLSKQSKLENHKQIDELKEKERQLQAKDKQLADTSRKCTQLEADKEKLQLDLQLAKKSDFSPSSSFSLTPIKETIQTTDIEDESPSEGSSPTKTSREEELLMKNSELGVLAKKMRDELQKLRKEKTQLEGKLKAAEEQVSPLRTRHEENMKKVFELSHTLDMKERQLQKLMKEKTGLKSDNEKLEKQLMAEQQKHKTVDRKTVELQRLRTQLEEKEKNIATLKEENNRLKIEQQKVQEEIHRVKREKAETRMTQLTTSTPDSSLAERRVREHKKLIELGKVVEEQNDKLGDMQRSKARLNQRVEDLNASLRRRDKQIKNLSDENHKLKSNNQTLEEARDKRHREFIEEWSQTRSELDRAHAQINKLQQKNSSLQEELERLNPSSLISPNTSTSPHHHTRSPSPVHTYTTSPHYHIRSPSPIHSYQEPSPSLSSPPYITFSPPPTDISEHVFLEHPLQLSHSYHEDDFGSQWSLASTESFMKEQIEQLEYDKDEMEIKYDEMKKEFGPLKGHYNALKERYRSLLNRSRHLQKKLQLNQKEHLKTQQENARLQKEHGGEFDVVREKNLREQLAQATVKINELEEDLTKQQEELEKCMKNDKEKQLIEETERLNNEVTDLKAHLTEQVTNNSLMKNDKEKQLIEETERLNNEVTDLKAHLTEQVTNKSLMKNDKEKQLIEETERLNNEVTDLKAHLTEQDTQLEQMKSFLADKESIIKEKEKQIIQLERLLAEKEGQLEGEKAIISSLQQQLNDSREGIDISQFTPKQTPSPDKQTTVVSSPPKQTPSPHKQIPLVSPLLQPHITDCLQSAQEVTAELQHVSKTQQSDDQTSRLEILTNQLQNVLSEAQGIMGNQSSSPSHTLGYDEPDAPGDIIPFQSPSDKGVGLKEDRFQHWMSQFETEKTTLKSKIKDLETRLEDGSQRVFELQLLVGDLEGRLTDDSSIPSSKDKYIASLLEQISNLQSQLERPMLAVPPIFGLEVSQAFQNTQHALGKGDMTQLRKEFVQLEHAISRLLGAVFPQGLVMPSPLHTANTKAMTHTSISPIIMHSDPVMSLSPSPPSHFSAPSPPISLPTSTHPPTTEEQVPQTEEDFRLFVTLLDYNPHSLCSTGHPERELTLHVGDVIAVVGQMNSNGYYTAIFDGKHGLVPASFVEEMKLSDKEAEQRLLNQSLSSSFTPTIFGSDVDIISPTTSSIIQKTTPTSDQMTPTSTSTPHQGPPAPPTKFRVERPIGGDCLLLTWRSPSVDMNGLTNGCVISGYSVLCDGVRKVNVTSNTTRVLLDGVNPQEPHTLSICTTTEEGPTSQLVTIQHTGHTPIVSLRPKTEEILRQHGSHRSSMDSDMIKSKLMIALYDYTPSTDSPNPQPELELQFTKGQILTIYGDMRDDGFFNGEVDGRFGLVPSNFIIESNSEDNDTYSPFVMMRTNPSHQQTPPPQIRNGSKRKLFIASTELNN